MRFFNGSSGEYAFSFFYIYIEKEIDFQDFESNNEEDKGTFIHEYCHYLQDVTTTFGAYSFIYYIQRLLAKLKQEYKQDVYQNNILTYNEDYYSLFEGDFRLEGKVSFIQDISIKKDTIYEEVYPNEDNEYIEILYDGGKTIHFGNFCVAESMAYLIEKQLYNVRERYEEFPYNMCEKVCQEEYEEFAKNEINIIGLCELSLLHYNGGVFFVKLLRTMKEENFLPQDVTQMVDFSKKIEETNFFYNREQMSLLLDRIYPKCSIDFLPIKEWIISRYDLAKIHRDLSKCFLSQMLGLKEKGMKFLCWNGIMETFGCPNVLNRTGDNFQGASLEGKEIDIQYMLAPWAIYLMLESIENNNCPLEQICRQGDYNMYREEFCSKPLQMESDNNYLCPIELFKKLYGIG